MIIGFTGTRKGMTSAQKVEVSRILEVYNPALVVHGDCVGADADFHVLAQSCGFRIKTRPCKLFNQRAWSEGADETADPEDPLARNRKIVNDSTLMIATPGGFKKIPYSGTWATITYTMKVGKPIFIIWPDGSKTLENF